MEEAVVGAIIQVVLQNLLSISIEEFNVFRGFKKDLQKLNRSVLMIKGLLCDAERQQVSKEAVKLWLKQLESVAFEAYNVFDELSYQVLRNKMEGRNVIQKKLQACNFRRKMAHKVRDINETLQLINQEARGFGLQIMRSEGAGFDAVAGRETDSFAADPIVVGRENDVSRIVEMLTTDSTQQPFSVLPIVGMGGLGKTTLARQVFSHEKIKTHFEIQIWVYVSRTFDAVSIFKKILESLTTESKIEFESRESVLRKIQKYLGRKRYVLVLDDVWNDSREKWDDFFNSLSGTSSVMGNGIIVTTRGENFALIVKTLPIYELEGLSDDQCWSIIKAKAFRGGAVPSEFEQIGRKIANRCQCLPLAAKVLGGMLCDKSREEWLAIEKDWLSNFREDENTVLNVLKLSFDHLSPPSLKTCFAYCSIFPKGFSMKREQLIELWMAEGFLTTDRCNDMETEGNKFFNLLVQNSLLQVVEGDFYGNVTLCNMHDLVHDLASSILGSKSTCMNDESLQDIHQVRYIGVESIGDDSFPVPKQQARCLRTLILKREVSDDMLLDFKNLHALVLMNEDVKELPSLIGELIHLRLLDISETRIKCLPDSIGKLYHLQTLRVVAKHEWESNFRRLPNTLKNLTCLRHLHIPNIELPPEIGKLTSLQTLPYFQVGHKKGCRIGELGSLKYLKGKLHISNLETVDDMKEAKSAHLFEKENIVDLKFAWDKLRNGATNDKNVLEGLQPHPNLKSLEIYGFKGVRFPSWTLKMEVRDDLEGHWIGLHNLMEIRLTSCGECEEIPTFGHLPHLKSLCLDGLTNVRSIGSSFYGIDNLIRGTGNGEGKNKIILFPALETLELKEMSKLEEWKVEFPSGAETQVHEIVVFPRLEHLVIENCCKLTSSPSHFPCLKKLEINEMNSASPLANICSGSLISFTELKICGLDGLVCLPDWLFGKNQNLSRLKIHSCPNLTHLISSFQDVGASLTYLWIGNCPNLRELPDDLHSLSLLETLWIVNCPNLKSIPYRSGGQPHEGFTPLRRLIIEDCKGLTNLPSEMIESCAPSLESLWLRGLINLTNLPVVIGCMQKMPRLTSLEIIDIPIITDISMETGSLHMLQSLSIGALYSASSLDYRLMQEFLNDMFKGLHSLHQVALYGIEHWDSLPDQLQHLTALSMLSLIGFGIEALPEWLGNMSSLQTIDLFNCKKLRRLPSKEAMQRLTKLTQLDILNCPQLNVERSNEQQSDDSQWPNISHIPRVYVDDRTIPTRGSVVPKRGLWFLNLTGGLC